MKICEKHWSELRAAIDERGLSKLVAPNGEVAARRAVAELSECVTKENFDPLLFAHNGIVRGAIAAAGLAVMLNNEDGTERCPICFCIEHCLCDLGEGCHFKHWIESAANVTAERAAELDLVAKA